MYVGASGTGVVVQSTAGRASLTVSLETSAPFSVSETSVVLGGGERREVEVRFAPVAAGAGPAEAAVVDHHLDAPSGRAAGL